MTTAAASTMRMRDAGRAWDKLMLHVLSPLVCLLLLLILFFFLLNWFLNVRLALSLASLGGTCGLGNTFLSFKKNVLVLQHPYLPRIADREKCMKRKRRLGRVKTTCWLGVIFLLFRSWMWSDMKTSKKKVTFSSRLLFSYYTTYTTTTTELALTPVCPLVDRSRWTYSAHAS